jgi:anti-anti-sigma factor
MIHRLFSIPGADPDLRVRGRLLKGTTLLLAVMSVLDLITIVNNPDAGSVLLILVSAILVVSLATFGLADYGFIRTGAVLLSLSIFLAISFGIDPDSLLNTPMIGGYIIPILVVGLVVGANAVIAFSALTLVALVALANIAARAQWLSVSIIILLTASGLIWLLIRTLEGSLRTAREQATLSQQAEQMLVSREQALISQKDQLETLYRQQQQMVGTIKELETPLLMLGQVLIIPLIGHIDSERADLIRQRVLEAVHRQRPVGIILDISGLSMVDTIIAQHLQHLIQSVQLLGSRVMITGISAAVAQTIVALNIDLGTIFTASSLQDGVNKMTNILN